MYSMLVSLSFLFSQFRSNVVAAYRKDKMALILNAVSEPGTLEELTGLAEMKREAAKVCSS